MGRLMDRVLGAETHLKRLRLDLFETLYDALEHDMLKGAQHEQGEYQRERR